MKKIYVMPCIKVKKMETESPLATSLGGSTSGGTTIKDQKQEGDPDDGNTAKENSFSSWSEE